MASAATPILRVVIEKGPGYRNGEPQEFKPKSTVRIGRVVKGNNLTIKDDGISSKHLVIEFNSDSNNWVLTDLDSSNGTILNTSQLKPLSPYQLRNGDEIKIGELTSIRVQIVEIGGEICPRRNPRRQPASKGGVDLGVVDEGANLGVEGSVKVRVLKGGHMEKGVDGGVNLGKDNKKGRGRGRAKKESVLADGNGDNVENVGVDVKVESNVNVEDVKPKQVNGVCTRRTRNSKRGGDDEFLSLAEPVPARRTRSKKNAEKVPENEGLDVGNCKEVENVNVVEGKKTRGPGRKRKLDVECPDKPKDIILDEMTAREMPQLEVQDVREDDVEKRMGECVQQNVLEGQMAVEESQLNVPEVREQPNEEPTADTVQGNVLEGTMTWELSQQEVPDVKEQPCEEPTGDSVQQYALEGQMAMEESQPNAADIREQVREEPMEEDKVTEKVAEVRVEEQVEGVLDVKRQACEQPMEDNARENDNALGASHYEQDTSHRLETDTMLEDGRVEETEKGDVSEESDTDAEGGDQEASNVPDLGKMTLGEWFDYLEVYLPKQIHAVTDEIIMDMRKRAKQFDDFMLQQQTEKGKLPVTT